MACGGKIQFVTILLLVLLFGANLRGWHVCKTVTTSRLASVGLCDQESSSLTETDNDPWYATLLKLIVVVVSHAVDGYFKTFTACWTVTGSWLVTMIDNYYNLLAFVTKELLTTIVSAVSWSVQGYFSTFYGCWVAIGGWLVVMIDNYISFLGLLVDKMLAFPTVIVLGLTTAVTLYFVNQILKTVCGLIPWYDIYKHHHDRKEAAERERAIRREGYVLQYSDKSNCGLELALLNPKNLAVDPLDLENPKAVGS